MKIARYTADGRTRLGIVESEKITPVDAVISGLTSPIELIERWPTISRRLQQAPPGHSVNHSGVRFEAPIDRPGKIMAIGANYAAHVAEVGMALPDQQVWFNKHVNCINGPFAPVQLPKVSRSVDYEVELVAVIGKRGRHISKAEAPQYVFGYCVGNDVTARDWQLRTTQWVLGKSFDTHAPLGPWITTADEISEPHNLEIQCLVNGELRQNSNTRDMVFNIWDQIACLSQAMTLEPGDLIFTGTPAGVGFAKKPPQMLGPSDRVRCQIEQLGHIENTFVPE
jgi:ureidoglycolate lyase